MSTPTKAPTTMDQTGAYFRKTIGVVPHNSDEDRHAATVHTARHSKDKEDFLDLADALGLNDVVDDMTEPGWRGE